MNNGDAVDANNRHKKFSSSHSVASSTGSNPSQHSAENGGGGRRSLQVNSHQSNNKRADAKSQQIYDTLNANKKSVNTAAVAKKPSKKATVNGNHQLLGDLNFDDTSTETESLINGFDDMRIHHNQQRPVVVPNQQQRPQSNLKSQFGSFSKWPLNHAINRGKNSI